MFRRKRQMVPSRGYLRNADLLKYFAPFRALSISAAYLTPFFQEHGLSLAQIFALQSIFSAAVVLWEVPSGMIADKIGRARSIKLSVPVAAAAMIAYSYSDSFWWFVAWEVLLAVASGLFSGVDEALLYDSLKAEGFAGEDLKAAQAQLGQRVDAYGYAAIAAGVPVAWLFYSYYGVDSTLLVDGLLTLVGGWLAFRLKEPPRYNGGQTARRLSAWLAFQQLARNAEARWLVVLTAALGTATYLAFWLSAPYYEQLGIPAAWFAAVLAIRSLFKAWLSHRFQRQLRLRRNMLVYSLLIGLVLAAMASGLWWLAPAILGHDIVQALHKRPVTARLNLLMHPDHRATMNSLVNLVQRLSYAAAGPFVGLVADKSGLAAAFIMMGVSGTGLALLALFRLDRLRTFHERR